MNPGWVRCLDRANTEAARTGRRQRVEQERHPWGPVVFWTTFTIGDPGNGARYVWPVDRGYRPEVWA